VIWIPSLAGRTGYVAARSADAYGESISSNLFCCWCRRRRCQSSTNDTQFRPHQDNPIENGVHEGHGM
jgi:hypothetical protein